MRIGSILGPCFILLATAACAPSRETAGAGIGDSGPAAAAADRPAGPIATGAAAPAGRLRLPIDQLEAMFRAAMAQARPFPPQKAVCFGIDEADRTLSDPPEALRRQLSRELALPGFPASQCAFDIYPYVTRTRDQAMLYTVRFLGTDEEGVRFMAVATYGNLGANGREFHLVRKGNQWISEPTGLQVVS